MLPKNPDIWIPKILLMVKFEINMYKKLLLSCGLIKNLFLKNIIAVGQMKSFLVNKAAAKK